MFRLKENKGIAYYTIDSFEATGLVKHCFTTRRGGVSEAQYHSMNLRMNCDDKRENVIKNFQIICEEIGVDYKKLVFSNQVHEDKIMPVDSRDWGNGITRPNSFDSADGLICAEPGVPIVTFFADCVPLFFLDVKKRVIALAHSGWKGTVLNIAAKTVEKMCGEYGCDRGDILTAIGPSIGECHFEVSDDVADIFDKLPGGVTSAYGEKKHVNLQKTIINQLLKEGIYEKNITNAGICTYCNSELLFSHRKTNGKRGNLAAITELK